MRVVHWVVLYCVVLSGILVALKGSERTTTKNKQGSEGGHRDKKKLYRRGNKGRHKKQTKKQKNVIEVHKHTYAQKAFFLPVG